MDNSTKGDTATSLLGNEFFKICVLFVSFSQIMTLGIYK